MKALSRNQFKEKVNRAVRLVRETVLHQHAKNEVGVRAGRFVDVAPLGCESCPLLRLLKLATGLEEAGGLHHLASVNAPLLMGVIEMIRHGGRVQQFIASRFSASKTELSFCHSILRRIWMLLTAVVQKIFLSEVSTSACTAASCNIARKGAFVVLVTHMLRISRLGVERLILCLGLARKLLECLVTVMRTVGV